MQLHFDASDFDRIAEAWKAAPDMVAEELTAAIFEIELLSQREIVERTPKGVGQGGGLAGSIIAENPHIQGVEVLGIVGTPLNYATAVELGTKPHMPPIEPLTDWVVHKLGISEAEAVNVAWRIASKIRKHGTKGVHMFEKGFEAVQPQADVVLQLAGRRIVQRLAEMNGA